VHVLVRSPEYWATIKENKPPVALAGNVSVVQGGILAGVLNATDDYDSLTQLRFSVLSPPENGELTLTGFDFLYTPHADFWGADAFTFTVTDGMGLSSAAVVNITVTHINALPIPICDARAVSSQVGPPFISSDELRRDLAALTDRARSAEISRNETAAGIVTEAAEAVAADIYKAELRTRALDLLAFFANDGTLIEGHSAYDLACSADGSWELDMGTSSDPHHLDVSLFAYDRDEEQAVTYRLVKAPLRGSLFATTALPGASYAQAKERSFLDVGGILFQAGLVESNDSYAIDRPGQPLFLQYRPEPLLRGLPAEVLSWRAEDRYSEALPAPNSFAVYIRCSPGFFYEPSVDADHCLPCAPGTFNLPDIRDQTACVPCPVGTECPGEGRTTVVDCAPGSYQVYMGCLSCRDSPYRLRLNFFFI
jgi:hypothetical protein